MTPRQAGKTREAAFPSSGRSDASHCRRSGAAGSRAPAARACVPSRKTPPGFPLPAPGRVARAPPRGCRSGPKAAPTPWSGTAGSAGRCSGNSCAHRPGTRRGRGAVITYQQQAFELPVCRVPVLPAGYPEHPSVLADHIKKVRIDKGFTQAGLAALTGADESTVWNWEHGRCPAPKHMPLVIRFLGYDPFPAPDPSDVYACLRHIKKLHGWTFPELGKRIGIYFELIEDWMAGRSCPSRRNIEKVARFLAENLTNSEPEGSFPLKCPERE